MWDKKIDSRLQSKIPESFFNSLLNGKSDPLGNFSKASLLDRVVCQITQEWSLQKLFSKCNTALQWDFFSGFGELKELYMSATPRCYCPSDKMVFRFLCWELHTSCLPCKYHTLLRKNCGVSWVFDLCLYSFDQRLPAGCVGCGWPWGDTRSLPRGAKQAGQWWEWVVQPAKKSFKRSPAVPAMSSVSLMRTAGHEHSFLGNSFLQSSALAVHKFNLQFSCWQELHEHLARGCKHTARGFGSPQEDKALLAPGAGVALDLGLALRGHVCAPPSKGPSWLPEPTTPFAVSKDQWLPCGIKHR